MSSTEDQSPEMQLLYDCCVNIVAVTSKALRLRSQDKVVAKLRGLNVPRDFEDFLDKYGVEQVALNHCGATECPGMSANDMAFMTSCQSVRDALNGLFGALQVFAKKPDSDAAFQAVDREARELGKAAHDLQMRTVRKLPTRRAQPLGKRAGKSRSREKR